MKRIYINSQIQFPIKANYNIHEFLCDHEGETWKYNLIGLSGSFFQLIVRHESPFNYFPLISLN